MMIETFIKQEKTFAYEIVLLFFIILYILNPTYSLYFLIGVLILHIVFKISATYHTHKYKKMETEVEVELQIEQEKTKTSKAAKPRKAVTSITSQKTSIKDLGIDTTPDILIDQSYMTDTELPILKFNRLEAHHRRQAAMSDMYSSLPRGKRIIKKF